MAYQINVPRSDYPGYVKWLGEQEYWLLKKVIGSILKGAVPSNAKLMDMACWDGEATRYYGDNLGIKDLYGLDFFEDQIAKALGNGVKVSKCDLELEAFPLPDSAFDVVVANQIFEHLKQIYRPIGENHRILKPGVPVPVQRAEPGLPAQPRATGLWQTAQHHQDVRGP